MSLFGKAMSFIFSPQFKSRMENIANLGNNGPRNSFRFPERKAVEKSKKKKEKGAGKRKGMREGDENEREKKGKIGKRV